MRNPAKKSLRKYYREARAGIVGKNYLSEIITLQIKSLEIYENAKLPVLYWAEKNEVSLSEICKNLWENRRKFGLPRCIGKNGEMQIFSADKYEMSQDCRGILSPLPSPANIILAEEIDLIFVPALAFDIFGNRLGQGGGYYDRFLPKCVNAVKIGVCFSCQISKSLLPADDFDEKVNFILSEKGIIKC